MKKETMRLSTTEQNIDRAIQRVVATYGPDLNAFFKSLQLQTKVADLQNNNKRASRSQESQSSQGFNPR